MKKGNGDSFISINNKGEFVYNNLNSHTSKRYKADTPMDKAFVPYLVMFLCGIIDGTCFLNLFKLISYDSPFLLAMQVAGFLFAFDIVPLYLGIQFRRVKQGISKDKFIIYMALVVCVMACVLNIVLRLMTMDQMAPNLSESATSFIGSASQVVQESDATGIDVTALSLALVGIVIPFVTSLGSFFVSYLLYDPLSFRKRKLEELLAEKHDELRRIEAILFEYDADPDFADHLIQDDTGKYEEMKKMQRALVLSYADYVRQRLKEHLANSTAINALSEETCGAILERLDRELAALDKAEASGVYIGSGSKDKIMVSNDPTI